MSGRLSGLKQTMIHFSTYMDSISIRTSMKICMKSPEETSILKSIGSDHMDKVEVTYSVNRTDFESCDDCVHYGDSLEMCKMRLCYHAIDKLRDCYERKEEKND